MGTKKSTESRIKRKVWFVVWTDKFRREERQKRTPIFCVEPSLQLKTKCSCHKPGWHYAEPFAIFSSKQEAIAFVEQDLDIIKDLARIGYGTLQEDGNRNY